MTEEERELEERAKKNMDSSLLALLRGKRDNLLKYPILFSFSSSFITLRLSFFSMQFWFLINNQTRISLPLYNKERYEKSQDCYKKQKTNETKFYLLGNWWSGLS